MAMVRGVVRGKWLRGEFCSPMTRLPPTTNLTWTTIPGRSPMSVDVQRYFGRNGRGATIESSAYQGMLCTLILWSVAVSV